MESIAKKIYNFFYFRKFKYQPIVSVLVFKNRLIENLKYYQTKYPKLKFAPVLKSNAYGHGLDLVASILDNEKVPFFVVDSFFEALSLRRQGISTKILVIGFCTLEQIESDLKDVSFTVTSLEILDSLSKNLKKPKNIHLKIDTGMHRQGILASEIDRAIIVMKSNQNIILEGICSHLANADGDDSSFSNLQITEWNKLAEIFKKEFSTLKFWHLSATAGVKFADHINANVARLGLGLYGIATSLFPSPLAPTVPSGLEGEGARLRRADEGCVKPTLEIKTIITSIKKIKAGEFVGYGITYKAQHNMEIATLPVGYYEGVDRRLSNIGWVKIKNQFCPIVGRVSMNISSVDVSGTAAKIGDEVVVISSQQNDKNSVENMAKSCNTIPYEILVHLPKDLRRVVV